MIEITELELNHLLKEIRVHPPSGLEKANSREGQWRGQNELRGGDDGRDRGISAQVSANSDVSGEIAQASFRIEADTRRD
jgi:hypothetical protein